MPKSVETLQRDLKAVQETLLSLVAAGQAQTPADLITLETYCAFRGISKKTVQNDIYSHEPFRVRRHPEFRNLRGFYVTDVATLRRWYESGSSSYYGDPAVEDALQRVASF